MEETNVAGGFLEALADRDFPRLASCLAPDVRFRMLLSARSRERRGRQAAASQFERWFGPVTALEVLRSERAEVAGHERLAWRFRLRDRLGEPGWQLVEQVAYCDLGTQGIQTIDLLCSGFQAERPAHNGRSHTFDAGSRGCTDVLAGEVRRQISHIAIGDKLVLTVRDPAAKKDVPALARLLGHGVTGTTLQPDGRLKITVERRK
jgi:TusA-related sulfurtransferase